MVHAHDESTEKATHQPAKPAGPATTGGIFALQRAIGNEAVAGIVQSVLRSSGAPLGEPVRQEMESRLGADFSDVRLHTDSAAQRSAAQIGARAYTSGNHVVIGRGGADPHTLAHELTHVIQQRGGPVSGVDNGSGLRVSDPADRFERDAEANAQRVMSGPAPVQRAEPHPRGHAVDGTVQRRVGFEFEAQWNVRDVSDLPAATAEYNQAVASRDQEIKVALLRRMVNSRRRNVPTARLTESDLAKTADALEQDWLNGNTPTQEGEDKLQTLGLTPGTPAWEAAAQPVMVDSRVSEPPLLGANLPKGRIPAGIVVAGNRFDLTADVSPTGGSNLEWVTDPLSQESEVVAVLQAITAMATYLNSRRNDVYIPSEEVLAGGGNPRGQLRIYSIPPGQELLFQPQVTGGMRIDTLVNLIEYFGQPGWRSGSRAKNQLMTEGLDPLAASLTGIQAEIRADNQLRRMRTGELAGLMSLVGSYLRTGASLNDGANPKSIAGGLLVRTDFGHNYSLLPREVKEYVQTNPDRFVSLGLAAAGMAAGQADERVYPNTVERGAVGSRDTTTLPLTRRQWLEGMVGGVDRLKHWDLLLPEEQVPAPGGPGVANEEDWSVLHPSLGGLGTTSDTIRKSSGKEVPALIAELRRMRGDRRVGDLEPLALAAFHLFERLGLGKSLRFP